MSWLNVDPLTEEALAKYPAELDRGLHRGCELGRGNCTALRAGLLGRGLLRTLVADQRFLRHRHCCFPHRLEFELPYAHTGCSWHAKRSLKERLKRKIFKIR